MPLVLIVLLLAVVRGICYAVFRWRIKGIDIPEDYSRRSLNGHMRVAAVVAVVIAVGLVVWLTVAYQSGNGPLALLFYVPIALAVGWLVGLISWSLTPLGQPQYQLVIRRVPKGRFDWDAEITLSGAALDMVRLKTECLDDRDVPIWPDARRQIDGPALFEIAGALGISVEPEIADYYLCKYERHA